MHVILLCYNYRERISDLCAFAYLFLLFVAKLAQKSFYDIEIEYVILFQCIILNILTFPCLNELFYIL